MVPFEGFQGLMFLEINVLDLWIPNPTCVIYWYPSEIVWWHVEPSWGLHVFEMTLATCNLMNKRFKGGSLFEGGVLAMDGHVTRNVLKKRQIFIEGKPVITRAFPGSPNSMAPKEVCQVFEQCWVGLHCDQNIPNSPIDSSTRKLCVVKQIVIHNHPPIL